MTTIDPTMAFVNPAWAHQREYVIENARRCKRTLQGGEGEGLTVLICGAGPSLATAFDRCVEDFQPDAVWGCNSALKWLWTHHKPVSHGVAVAGEEGLLDDWQPFPPVQYYVSSGVYPVIPKMLEARHRKAWFFHITLGPNLGVEDEPRFYADRFPPALIVKPSGAFNITNVAVVLAIGMGFERIVVAGADCCFAASDAPRPDPLDPTLDDDAFHEQNLRWKATHQMYVDGRDPITAFGPDVITPDGMIAGRHVVSRPDMLLSAVHLVELAKHFPERVILAGDTLPNFLLRTPESEWRHLMPAHKDNHVVNFQPIVSRETLLPQP